MLAVAAHNLSSVRSVLRLKNACNFMIALGVTNPKDSAAITLWVPESHNGGCILHSN